MKDKHPLISVIIPVFNFEQMYGNDCVSDVYKFADHNG